MKHGSLFSGIGGFDLAAEWMGWENVFHCEWKEFNQRVLKYYWPNATSYTDICKTDFSIHRGTIDILTGGFPCQPYSVAGKRKGKYDERHLWPEMLRSIREIKPTWVLGENVRGLISWDKGLVFDEVQADLETEGYEVLPFLLPAAGVNAPHRRDRVWFIAYSNTVQREREVRGVESIIIDEYKENASNTGGTRFTCREEGRGIEEQERLHIGVNRLGKEWSSANPNEQYGNIPGFRTSKISQQQEARVFEHSTTNNNNKRLQGGKNERIAGESWQESIKQSTGLFCTDWKEFPTVSPLCNGNDGLSYRLDAITFSKWRTESIQAGGNAVVPQVVYQIFKAIEEFNKI